MRFIARVRPVILATAAVATLVILVVTTAAAQSNLIRRDTAVVNRSTNPLLSNFRFRSIGPPSMGGRIDDIAV